MTFDMVFGFGIGLLVGAMLVIGVVYLLMKWEMRNLKAIADGEYQEYDRTMELK